MKRLLPLAGQLSRSRWLSPLAILFTLGVLGGTICFGTLQLRESTRAQIIRRDAEVLDAVLVLEQLGARSPADLARQLEDAIGQMDLALRLSRLRQGVLAVRLFDATGAMVAALPTTAKPAALSPAEQSRLRRLEPQSRLETHARLQDYFGVLPGSSAGSNSSAALLTVRIPIHAEGQDRLLAVAELLQDGSPVARELARLDVNLARQAAITFGLAGGTVALLLAWTFHRLHRLGHALHDHALQLRRANQDLALSAKTSALGTVTAHIIHGLTSPLNALQTFVHAHATDDGEGRDALKDAQRLQTLVGDIVRVLGEQTDGTVYHLPLNELPQILADRTQPLASTAGVVLEFRVLAEDLLSNQTANLVLLILENLLQNAIQATPNGGRVRLSVVRTADGVSCEIADEGGGLSPALQKNLFVPCRSTKLGGHGLGLAISQHLARHLGAELKLVRSGGTGSTFALRLPHVLLGQTNSLAGDLAAEMTAD